MGVSGVARLAWSAVLLAVLATVGPAVMPTTVAAAPGEVGGGIYLGPWHGRHAFGRGATDAVGNQYVGGDNAVFRLTPDGSITTIAGTPMTFGFAGDGGPGADALFGQLWDVVAWGGDLFVADTQNLRIRRISLTAPHTVTTLAQVAGRVSSLSVNPATGTIYAAGYQLQPVSISQTGVVTNLGVAADLDTSLGSYQHLSYASGSVYVTDGDRVPGRSRVLRFDLDTGVTTELTRPFTAADASNGTCTLSAPVPAPTGDGWAASDALLCAPLNIAADADGTVFVSEVSRSGWIRRIAPDGTITSLVGGGARRPWPNNVPGENCQDCAPQGTLGTELMPRQVAGLSIIGTDLGIWTSGTLYRIANVATQDPGGSDGQAAVTLEGEERFSLPGGLVRVTATLSGFIPPDTQVLFEVASGPNDGVAGWCATASGTTSCVPDVTRSVTWTYLAGPTPADQPDYIVATLDLDGDGVADGSEPSSSVNVRIVESAEHVALGDSFSSGEGNPGPQRCWLPVDASEFECEPPAYLVDPLSGNDDCHRSTAAYPRLIVNPGTGVPIWVASILPGLNSRQWFYACTGALTEHVTVAGQLGLPPQLDRAQIDADTDLVTVTIGGNDMRFSEFIMFCFVDVQDCQDQDFGEDPLRAYVAALTDVVQSRVEVLLREIREEAPNASVFILGYPQLFPALEAQQRCEELEVPGLEIGMEIGEQEYFREAQVAFNDGIASAARVAGVHYVPVERVGDGFDNHEPCTSEPWINGYTIPMDLGASFHPNRAGHAGFARLLNERITELIEEGAALNAAGFPRNPNPLSSEGATPPETEGGTLAPFTEVSTAQVEVAAPLCPGTVALSPGGVVTVSGEGFTAGTIVELTVSDDGVETTVATTTATAEGTALVATTAVDVTPDRLRILRLRGTGSSGSAVAMGLVYVSPDPIPCALGDESMTTFGAAPTPLNVLANDVAGTVALVPSTLSLVAAPVDGSATVSGGAIHYTPPAVGDTPFFDWITYRVCDSVGRCTEATVSVFVDLPQPCTIFGTELDDHLVGSLSDDVICALGGADTIDAGGGNDIVYGGSGADIIRTGVGDDRIDGGEGVDVINAGAGADTVVDPRTEDVVFDPPEDPEPPEDPPVIQPGLGSVVEGDSGTVVLNVPVTLSEASSTPVTVDWTTVDTGADAVARAGVDYVSALGTVTFLPGETSQTVSIQVKGDVLHEPLGVFGGEWALVAFTNPSGATIDMSFFGVGVGVILDDDPPPTINIGSAIVFEGDSGTTPLVVQVTLTHPSAVPVSVNWSTGSGEQPQVGIDYQAATGTVTFAPGETSKNVTVTVYGDTVSEPGALVYGYNTEWLSVGLSGPVNGTLNTDPWLRFGFGVIVDDD